MGKRHIVISTSDQTPNLGGNPIFKDTSKRKAAETENLLPLLLIINRECEASYSQKANANKSGELKPWLKTIMRAQVPPNSLPLTRPMVTTPMCTTDEYAIRTFKSPCRRQINAPTIEPTIAMLM